MPKLIKNRAIVEDDFVLVTTIEEGADAPEGNVILPVQYYLDNRDALASRDNVAVWLESDQPAELLNDIHQEVAFIAVNFPKFADGRGYSYARLIRERMNYTGELRAIGDVLLDQLHFMARCGFDSFAVREDTDIEEALTGFEAFRYSYQAANDNPSPLFRKRLG
ncbi:DUF934 domain-containing protein [Litoribrevibacter albus]|uniref:DUF934 domain-containing protein n=1 Tax=Litoribrevibacter albus TaxID=1473156 RepID=A0AA37W934_9GAMM|nr:DUF934 domain-containing protein [Litoribrevibacter albus]GLQ32261.1 hypothetical protein GCM10007876_27400 [Litoribrevibacter albus]